MANEKIKKVTLHTTRHGASPSGPGTAGMGQEGASGARPPRLSARHSLTLHTRRGGGCANKRKRSGCSDDASTRDTLGEGRIRVIRFTDLRDAHVERDHPPRARYKVRSNGVGGAGGAATGAWGARSRALGTFR